MKLLVTALENDVESKMDPRFGRARYWYIYDTEKKEGEFIDNSANMSLDHGAGIQAATAVIDKGIDVLITGSVGPKAFGVLKNSNVRIYKGYADLSIKENIESFLKDELEEVQSAGSPHF